MQLQFILKQLEQDGADVLQFHVDDSRPINDHVYGLILQHSSPCLFSNETFSQQNDKLDNYKLQLHFLR